MPTLLQALPTMALTGFMRAWLITRNAADWLQPADEAHPNRPASS